MHRQFAEVDRTAAEPQKVPPFLNALNVFLRITVDFFEVGIDDVYPSQVSTTVRRRQEVESVETNVGSRGIRTWNVFHMEKVGQSGLERAKQAPKRDLQHVNFSDMYLY